MEKKAPKKPQGWLVLFLVSLVAALALAGTNELTKGAIEQRSQEASDAARIAVFSEADSFKELQVPEGSGVDNGYQAFKGGQAIGYVAQSTVQGYGGPIEVVAGMDLNGSLTAISVGGANFAETAGLGSKAKEPSFTDQFKGLTLPAKLRDNVDAISGATITSNAVVLGVNQAGTYMASVAGISIEDKTPSQVKVEGNTVTVTKDGFGGPIDITITVDDSGAITAITVGGDQFAESPGYGAKAKEPLFTDQFIGKSGKLTLNADVDAISGATITSNAVVNGVNEALAALRGEAVTTPEPAPEPTPVPEGRTAKATKEGFEGPIEAVVIVDDEGKIVGITIGANASFNETQGIGTQVKESAFTDQFIGKTGPFEIGKNIDSISGATWSSKGAVDAVNAALESLGDEPAAQTSTETKPAAAEGKSATATVKGFAGNIDVTVTVDDGGAIAALTVGGDQFAETEGLGAKAKEVSFTDQFIGKKGTVALGTDVDAIAGATITTKAVVEGVNEALASLSGAPEATPAPTPEATAVPEGRTASATKEGFESPIEVVVTVDDEGKILAMTVGENKSFAETEGLGTKVKDEAFIAQFIGQAGPFEVGKNIDAVARATFSSKGVVEAVNAALESMQPASEEGPEPQGRTASATKEGFESPIEVVVTVDDAGKILAMTVGENKSFAETEGLGTKVKDEAFIAQFIGKIGPFEVGKNIDAVAGATFSSKGVVEAVNAALESLLHVGEPAGDTAPQARTASATKEGFESPIEVVITVDDAGKILTMTVGENKSFAETEGLGTKVKDEAFIAQFIGKTGPFEVGKNIDAVTGATFSSKGVVEAVNAAIESLPPVGDVAPQARTASATKEGFESPIEVVITLDDAGKILTMTVGENKSFAETEGLGTKVKDEAFIAQFIGKTGPFEVGKNIDAVTGATFSSKGVVEAVNAALESLAK